MLQLRAFSLILGLVLTLGVPGCNREKPGAGPVMVFAAASLRDVMQDLAAEFAKSGGSKPVRFNFGGSNDLAQQISAGAPADVFVSADEAWIQFVEDKGKLVPESRQPLLANRLVVVAHKSSSWALSSPSELAGMPYRFLALANPDAVPAGKYAKRYLSAITASTGSVWDAVQNRVAPAMDVRFTLNLVESDASVIGMVYRSDAMSSPHVRILYEIPESEVPVVYYAARIRHSGGEDAPQAFFQFMTSPAAGAIFAKHGFVPYAARETAP
jgi:molybdate transport system substrate-binding protein